MHRWICDTCGLELSSKHTLQCHIDRKFKCQPPSDVVEVHECTTCGKQFKRKNLLEQHFGTEKHKRAVAAIEAAAGPSSSVVTSESHNTSHVHSHNTHNTTNNITNNNYNVHAHPRSFGKAEVDYLVSLTSNELIEKLDIRDKCGLTPFLNLFKLLHLNPDIPKNHNVLIETAERPPLAFAFKQRHWRDVDSADLVRECVNNAAIRFLDIESILVGKLSTKLFDRITKVRDIVERETDALHKHPGTDVQNLMRRTERAIMEFTDVHPDLLAHAKEDAQSAPEMRKAVKTRDLPEWEIGKGHRWLALAKMQETGEWPMPPSR